VIRKYVRDGHLIFNRLSFLQKFHEIFNAGFLTNNVIKGFSETDLWPITANKVLRKLALKKISCHDVVLSQLRDHIPRDQRFVAAEAFIEQISQDLNLPKDSPTRRALKNAKAALNEASMMQSDKEIYSQYTQRRIEAYASKRQRGAIVKPNTEGHFITSISKGELLEKAFLEQLLNTLGQ
jgi:hypothetical protein